MLKNYTNEEQKLPLFGVGPYIVYGMDNSITENKLQTKGIYSWVRNPMYSGWWIALSGGIMFWHNVWMLILPLIDWLIMTVALINTEEKWLLDLYGDEYARYKKQVNRCIPWKRKVRVD